MQKLSFFPVPYPDECYYSIFCRYFVRSGSTSNKRTIFELFGEAQSITSFVFLPRRLELAETWAGTDSIITRETLACRNSCYAYFSISFTEPMLQGMEQEIKTGKADRSLERQSIQKCRRSHWHEYLRYCPDCALEDIEKYGETYWHRLPQLPGIEYCPKHGKPIQNSNARLRQTTMAFLPASYALREIKQQEDTEKQRYRQKYLKIANDTEWLLENGLKLKGCCEIARKCKELFREKGLTTAQGARYRDRIKREFIGYHGEEFLKQLFPDEEHPLYWLEFAFVSMSGHLRPLHHVLLMEFLKDSAKSFYESVPDNEPYGKGPWPCVNKVCRHYGNDGAEKISITYLNGQTIGHFQCTDCGMKYQRSNPWQRFEEYAGHAIILDYGHYWCEMMEECIEVRKMGLAETAKAMKCTSTTIKKRAEEIGLNLNQNRKSCIYREREESKTDPSSYFRRKVRELLLEQPELTAKELDERIPGAYSWFHKNDFQWLKEQLVTDKEKHYWVEWEQEQLELLKAAYETIKDSGVPDRRITIGWLCTTAGLRERDIKGRLHRFPNLRNFIGGAVESKEEWLIRRFTETAKKKLLGGKLELADIRRELSLKPNTYQKYSVFIETLIGEINSYIQSNELD